MKERIYCTWCKHYSEVGVNRVCLLYREPIEKWYSPADERCYDPRGIHAKEIIDLGDD